MKIREHEAILLSRALDVYISNGKAFNDGMQDDALALMEHFISFLGPGKIGSLRNKYGEDEYEQEYEREDIDIEGEDL
jgi:hypothetical protein